jgi:CHRD domain
MVGLVTAVTVIIFVATNGLASYALAQKQFMADLAGNSEVPPVDSTASGIAKFQLSGDGQSLDYQINVTNTNMGAHIHTGKIGQNGPVIAALSKYEQSSYR